jgi:hypothetical protein
MSIIKWIQETFCKDIIAENEQLTGENLKLKQEAMQWQLDKIWIIKEKDNKILEINNALQTTRQELVESNLTDVDKWCKKNNIPMVEKAYKDKIFINELKLPCYLNELFLPTSYVIKKAKEKIKYDTDDCTWFTRITNFVHNKVKWTWEGQNDNYYYPNYTLQKGLGDCEDQAYVQMSIEPQIAVAYGFRIQPNKSEFGHSFGVGVINGDLFIFDAVDNEVKKYTKNDGWRIHFIVTKNGTYVLDNSVEFGEILWG